MPQTEARDTGPVPLLALLEAAAARDPGALAVVSGDRRLTWAEMHDGSVRMAKGLMALGVERGDRIANWLPNRPDWLLLWLAAMRVGAAVVPVNTRYRAEEAAYVLRKAQVRALFMEPRFLNTDFTATFREICPNWDGAGCSALPDLRHVFLVGEGDEDLPALSALEALGQDVTDAALAARTAALSPRDPVVVVFTSGTTGKPKGVVHDHDAARMMQAVVAWMGLGPQDRILGHLPLFHVAGVFSSFLPAMITGGALVQMDAWDPAEALRLVEAERVSVLSGIPTHFFDLLRHPDLAGRDVGSLRTGWIGGATVPAEVVAGAAEKLGMHALLPVYGMTETTSTTTLARPDDPPESIMAGRGLPLGGYEVETVNPDTRQPVAAGQEGEIRVRGYTVMKGYLNDPEATARVMDGEGWFYTGDLGVLDAEGYLRITGRRSDMFIVGGNNVHPADVEHVLLAMPEIKQAHVVAGPDARLGEVAVAFVELTAEARQSGGIDEEEIIARCRARLASFKTPRRVVFVEAWPMTPTGKVQRFRLRELAVAPG